MWDCEKKKQEPFSTPAYIKILPYLTVYSKLNALPGFMSKVLTHVALSSTCGNGYNGFGAVARVDAWFIE